jgi:hypothetical protein
MYYESTLVVQKVVVHKQFFRQSHCFTYIVESILYRDVNSCSWAVTMHFAVRWGHMVLSFSSRRTAKALV